MSLEEKVNCVIKLFHLVDADINRFKKRSGLSCIRYCHRCCISNKITSTVLELLPLAYWIAKKNKHQKWLKILESHHEDQCFLLRNFSKSETAGRCLVYKLRPLICRLFGFSAVLDKKGFPKLVTCLVIKNVFHENYQLASNTLNSPKIPIMKKYCSSLYSVDFAKAQKYYPINEALRMALEEVYLNSIYQCSPSVHQQL